MSIRTALARSRRLQPAPPAPARVDYHCATQGHTYSAAFADDGARFWICLCGSTVARDRRAS